MKPFILRSRITYHLSFSANMGVLMPLLCVAIITSLVYSRPVSEEERERARNANQCFVDGYEPCLRMYGMPDTLTSANDITFWMLAQIDGDMDNKGVSKFWNSVEMCSITQWPEYGDAFKGCKYEWNGRADNPKFDTCMMSVLCQY